MRGLSADVYKSRVLVVEDSGVEARAAARLLGTCPDLVVVGHASTGEEGLRLVRETSPDVVLLDVSLPDISGWDVVEALTETRHPARIVLWSAHDHNAYRDAARMAGAVFVWKPVAGDELVEAIRAQATAPRLKRVASALLHDFNNLLSIIKVNASLLQEVMPDDESVEQIGEATTNAALVSGRLLDLVSGRRSDRVQAACKIDVREATAGLVQALSPLFGNVKVRCDADETLPLITASPQAFDQVVINLLLSARDSLGDSGEIELRAVRTGDLPSVAIAITAVDALHPTTSFRVEWPCASSC